MRMNKNEYRLNIIKTYALETGHIFNFRDVYLHLNSYITPPDRSGKGGVISKLAAVTTSELRRLLKISPDYVRLDKDEWEYIGDDTHTVKASDKVDYTCPTTRTGEIDCTKPEEAS